MQYTSGKYAKAICDRCGVEMKYTDLRTEWTGLRVCKSCLDPKTAQEFPSNFPTDPEALRDPRPDNDIEASLGIATIQDLDIGSSFKIASANFELGEVTVTLS